MLRQLLSRIRGFVLLHPGRVLAGSLALLGLAAAAPVAPTTASARPPRGPWTIVVCAPGYPGTTETAQPTMDRFARAAAEAAGRSGESLRAIYFETEAAGLRRLAEPDAALALVPLPFFVLHGEALGLEARLQVVQTSGPAEIWGLAAKRGALVSAASLAGWEVTGTPGYAPQFVRGAILGGWGEPPADAQITSTSSVLSALRRAAAGEKIAVLVDAAQARALPSLPFGGELEIVTRSPPLPGTLLCLVGARLGSPEAETLLGGLTRLRSTPKGAEALDDLRMIRFETADLKGIDTARRAAAGASKTRR